jgi:hypothetical protein
VAAKRSNPSRSSSASKAASRATSLTASFSRRTKTVWAIFLGAMTIVTGLLLMRDSTPTSGFLLTSVDVVGAAATSQDSVFHIAKPLDRNRWSGIVIHHLGEPAGDADSVTRLHQKSNIKGLGYHFLIGNGNGLGDGVVHVGYRWNEQLPGAHVLGQAGELHNQRSIGICLIGNGDRRGFTDRQLAQLSSLVQRLQRELDIPAGGVHLHRELVSQTSSPGKFFPAARFREQLLD